MIDDTLARAAANCAEAYRTWVAGVGRPWRVWDDLVVADMGLPVDLPPNHASVLRPLTDDAVPDVIERMRSFFDGSPGGPFALWSAWPTPDLEIVEVVDERSAAGASALLAVFGTPPDQTAGRITPALASETFRFWLGRVDGEPASMAASVSHGYVSLYAVATAPAFRATARRSPGRRRCSAPTSRRRCRRARWASPCTSAWATRSSRRSRTGRSSAAEREHLGSSVPGDVLAWRQSARRRRATGVSIPTAPRVFSRSR